MIESASLQGVIQLLKVRQRPDLVQMLQRAKLEFDVSSTYGSYLFSSLTTAEIYAPVEDYEQLISLPEADRDFIFQALIEVYPPKAHDIEIVSVRFLLDSNAPLTEDQLTDNGNVMREIQAQQDLMIDVSTGGQRINQVNQEYLVRRESLLHAFDQLGIKDPNPYSDLWHWYRKWSSGDLPSYQSRREYIWDLYAPLIEGLRQRKTFRQGEVFDQITGWAKVDRGLGEIRNRLEQASTEEQFQAVGLLCRETLISLAQTVYDPIQHIPQDGVLPSGTDAKRMLEGYLAKELAERTNEAARRHAKAALDLANDVQHRRTATFRHAALCAEATTSLVNLIAIISGRRDPAT